MIKWDNENKEEKLITYRLSQNNNRISNTISQEKKENIQRMKHYFGHNKIFSLYYLNQKTLFLGLILVSIILFVQIEYTFALGNELQGELLVNLLKSNVNFGFSPLSIAVDGSGNVYVADTDNHHIQKFTGNGSFITQWGFLGNGAGQFYNPNGVAVDGSGNVYVSDSYNNRIQKFTGNG